MPMAYYRVLRPHDLLGGLLDAYKEGYVPLGQCGRRRSTGMDGCGAYALWVMAAHWAIGEVQQRGVRGRTWRGAPAPLNGLCVWPASLFGPLYLHFCLLTYVFSWALPFRLCFIWHFLSWQSPPLWVCHYSKELSHRLPNGCANAVVEPQHMYPPLPPG